MPVKSILEYLTDFNSSLQQIIQNFQNQYMPYGLYIIVILLIKGILSLKQDFIPINVLIRKRHI